MTSETRTPAQQTFHRITAQTGSTKIDLLAWAAFNRAEEVAASVAALAEMVAELKMSIDAIEQYLAQDTASAMAYQPEPALESPAAAPEPNPVFGPPLQTWDISLDVKSWEEGKPLESPAVAPEPVCQCGHAASFHLRYSSSACCHKDSLSTCQCQGFVLAVPLSAPEPSRGISQVMADAFWSAKEVYSHSNDADVDICKRLDELSEVIDAQLSTPEPHDAARLRETIAHAGFNSFYGGWNPNSPEWSELSDETQTHWLGVADAVIRAIGGAR